MDWGYFLSLGFALVTSPLSVGVLLIVVSLALAVARTPPKEDQMMRYIPYVGGMVGVYIVVMFEAGTWAFR